MNEQYYSSREARKLLCITNPTLRKWAKTDKIKAVKIPSGQYIYNRKDISNILNSNMDVEEKKKITYCRVSSKKQINDLKRQEDFFRNKYPNHTLVSDVGSGINWNRKSFKTILEQSMLGNVSEVVVAHRDRLCRFAFDLVEWILKINNTKLVVLDRSNDESPDKELSNDLLSIIHIYSCKQMGRRRYAGKKNTDLSKQETEENIKKMDGYK